MKPKKTDNNLTTAISIYRESLENEKTIQQLCDEYGIGRTTYYKYAKANNELFDALAEFVKEQKRLLYTELTTARLKAIKMLAQEVLSPLLSPGARIHVMHEIKKFMEEIENELNIVGEEDLVSQILRTLPPLEYGKNVLEPPDPKDRYSTGELIVFEDE